MDNVFQVRPLTRVGTSVHRDQDVIVLFLDAQAATESEPLRFVAGLTVEQANSVVQGLQEAIDELSGPRTPLPPFLN